jgi:hypothetical protein
MSLSTSSVVRPGSPGHQESASAAGAAVAACGIWIAALRLAAG